MKWLKNIESIVLNGSSGICPYCGSNDTEYAATIVFGDMGFGDVWCNSCKNAYHISRIKIQDGFDSAAKTVPTDLKY
ncbi:MAG: hypothetical protein IJ496_04510 [Ruminococcus sp.]|nr:hypothetical protein [Ruminococcus sp.]